MRARLQIPSNNNNATVPDVIPRDEVSRQTEEKVPNTAPVIGDLPDELPSVKDLANKFIPRKSPEPMPRKSILDKVIFFQKKNAKKHG